MEKSNIVILLVDDEPDILEIVGYNLTEEGYQVVTATNGLEAIEVAKSKKPQLIILDVMMPEMDGFTLAREIRTFNTQVPILFLTAKTQKHDMIEGYQIGCDDYVTKPFDTEVLLLKINAILSRNQKITSTVTDFNIGHFIFNSSSRELRHEETNQKLSPKEAKLLQLLCEYKNNVVSREMALNNIWGDNNYFTTRSMDVFITKLRKRLKSDSSIEIINVHGNGFRLLAK